MFHWVPFLQQVSRTFVSRTYKIDERIGLSSAFPLDILTTRKNFLLQEKLYYSKKNYIITTILQPGKIILKQQKIFISNE